MHSKSTAPTAGTSEPLSMGIRHRNQATDVHFVAEQTKHPCSMLHSPTGSATVVERRGAPSGAPVLFQSKPLEGDWRGGSVESPG